MYVSDLSNEKSQARNNINAGKSEQAKYHYSKWLLLLHLSANKGKKFNNSGILSFTMCNKQIYVSQFLRKKTVIKTFSSPINVNEFAHNIHELLLKLSCMLKRKSKLGINKAYLCISTQFIPGFITDITASWALRTACIIDQQVGIHMSKRENRKKER